jgi:HlyD family secretion protein
MKTNTAITALTLSLILAGCRTSSSEFDATGNFEADEVIISSEASGKILKFDIEEGNDVEANAVVGLIDTTQLYLRKKQLEYSIKAVVAKSPNVSVQLAAIKEQMETTQREKRRVENLLKDDAATQKQLDDLSAALQLLQRQYDATQSSLSITTQSIQSETMPLKAQLEQVQDQLNKSVIRNPFDGTVLTKYALKDEMTAQGKALYKVADLSSLVLRAYISGSQLSQVKLGQKVDVFVDAPEGEYKKYPGEIMWISEKAEFTPKTIQTKEERANLVYATKIRVKNDGYLKLGMYGEVNFAESAEK